MYTIGFVLVVVGIYLIAFNLAVISMQFQQYLTRKQ